MKKHVSYTRLFILVLVPILATLLIFSDVSANYQIIKKKAPVLLMNLLDLIVESIRTDPKEIVEDGTIELKSVIRNIGTVEAKDFAIDFLLDGKAIHRWPNLILGPNQIFTAQIPKQVVRGIGTHNFTCRVDAENRVREKNETNNEKTVVFTIKKKSEEVFPPDIAVTLISINPLNPTTIDSIKFSVTIKNVGQKIIEDVPVSVGWRYKKKGETSWRNKSMFSNNIGRLAPSETMQVKEDTISFRIQDTGDYLFEIDELVLGGNLLGQEANLNDNHMSLEFRVSESASKSDLLVKEISIEPSLPSKGSSVVIRAVIANNGAESNQFAARMKLLRNAQVLNEWTESTSPGLRAGGSYTFQRVVQGLETGTYSIEVEVDYTNNNQEIDEQNNKKSFNFDVKEEGEALVPPDIAVIGISINPLNPTTIDSIKFSVTIKNVGQKIIEDVPVSVGWRYKKKGETSWRDKSMFSNNIGRLAPSETMQVKEDTISFRIQDTGDYLFEIDELVLGGNLLGQEKNLNDNHMSIEFKLS